MIVILTKANSNSEQYKLNYEKQEVLYVQLEERLREVKFRGNEPQVIRHKQRGKLLARERINLLIDKATPFLEFSALAAYNRYGNQFPSAGIVTGVGLVHNRAVIIVANDATVKGGTYVAETIKKHLRAQEIAMDIGLPCIYLVDSGGIFLPEQASVFADKENFGRIFFNQAQMSANSIPQISVVMGSCTAGGAYIPAMSDEAIMVRTQATIFLGGPPLVKAATGEDITAEELGGAQMHTSVSGVADHIAENDSHAIEMCRDIVAGMSPHYILKPPANSIAAPICDMSQLFGVIPADEKQNTDPYEIIARIVDGSQFQEFKPDYGTTLVTGFAQIMGYTVGIVANNGILFAEAAQKGAHFIQICCHRNICLLFLQDIAGFMVGREYEHGGIAKDGAKMVQAVANASVPKITVITGKSYGAGNYAMAGRAFNSNFLFLWPNARIAVMGGEQAANVLGAVKSKSNTGNNDALADVMERYNNESSPYYSTSRLWDDGIINPRDTRIILGMCLSVLANRISRKPSFGIFRM